MKKILLAIGFFIALSTEAQVVNKFRDSSVFFKGVRFDSTLVFKGLKSGSTADTNVVVISSTGKASKVSKSAFLGDLPIYSISDSNTVIDYDVLNSQNAPPGSPATGDTYLVGTSPSGAWVGHAKDIAEWNGSAWVFTDGVQGDFLYNATNALTYIFRSGNWVQTTGIPALNNGNTISSGLIIGTNNARSLKFETNNVNRGRFDSVGRFYVYDTSLRKSNKYLQIDSITGRLVASEISGGGGGGGGSPAGSDNQIQINQSGAFFADSTFQKSDTDFNVGLDHTQQSAVTFTGTGVDNFSKNGTFSGPYPTTYTITIDGINKDYVNFPISSISGSGFQVGETLTSSSGGSATIDAINVNSNNSYENLVLSGVTGTFLQFDVITGSTSSTTATIDSDLGQQDTYSWTDGTNSGSNVICKISGTNIQNGLSANFDTGSGHTLSDSWTWTYSNVNQNVLDFSNGTYKFGTDFGTDYFGYEVGKNILGFGLKGSVNTWVGSGGNLGMQGIYEVAGFHVLTNSLLISGVENGMVSKQSGEVVLGNLSGGNNTKITIDDVNEHITINNLPAYDDDTTAGMGGLTAGMVYMTTGSGSAPLNAAGILMIKQ